MSNVLDSSRFRTLLQVISLVAFGAITAFLWPIFFGNLGPGGEYRIVVLTLLALSYLLFVPSLIRVIMNEARSRTLRLGVAVTSAIACVAVAALVFGVLQDLLGVHCDGFFGARQLCVDSAWFWVFFVFIFSPALFVVTLTVIGLLSFGLADEYRKSQSGKKPSARKR